MSQRDDEFTQVLERLEQVREELSRTSSPERVGVLTEVAGELVAQGEALLGRHLRPGGPPDAVATAPGQAVPGDGPATQGPVTGVGPRP